MTRPVRLRNVGEDAVVATVARGLKTGPEVRAGIGDDCAVLGRPRDRWWRLLKTDAVVEDVHFTAEIEAARVGWKALCRALSDFAAMAGIPEHALITIAAPKECELRWLQELYRGLRRAAARHGVEIVGGETSRSPGATFINVMLTGRVESTRCVFRSGGKVGDVLFVTGRLGGSLKGKHLDFTPRLREARWLAEHFKPRAMMDLSDGLAADLPRLALASRCSYELDEDSVPRSRGCTIQQALNDGEDFELLFAVDRKCADQLEAGWRRVFRSTPLTRIGRLTARSSTHRRIQGHGFDHFA